VGGLLRELIQSRSALVADVDHDPEGEDAVLIRSNLTGTMQLYELIDAADFRQLTALPEPVASARYLRGTRRAVIEVDRGGNERHQIYVVDLTRTSDGDQAIGSIDELTALTSDDRFGHHLAGVSPDGSLLAYVSNKANGVDFDLWLCELETGAHRCLYAGGSWCQPASGFSPDGRWISVLRPGNRPLDEDLLLVEVATGEARVVLAHPEAAAQVGAPQWIDASTFVVSSNVGTDLASVQRYDLATGEVVPYAYAQVESSFDALPIASNDGRSVLVIENRDGAQALLLTSVGDPAHTVEIPLVEPGVVVSWNLGPPIFSRDDDRLYFTHMSPRRGGDVWVFERPSGEVRQVTASPAPVAPDELVLAEVHEAVSFDGERVPLFVFRPAAASAPPPVVVVVHGGPEAQAMQTFNPVVQGLVDAGYAVVVPNVRGSTGYGKRYAGLDDTTRRLDSVRDLAAVHGWLADNGLDATRAALLGGSYGGYMVLAGLTFQPDLWAAGVDIVGISDLVTFLENTSDYRRAHREREYGSLTTDREFLVAASPMTHVDEIRAPLFVIHGRNDPRVPVSEAEQLVKSLSNRGVRCELLIYEDEGHGLARLENQLDAYPQAVAFLDEALGV
jgi:dipeptidyl aminopeptidase/acylaminoacyl peptidase